MVKDRIFREQDSGGKPFVFNAAVADVFPDMLKRSIPGYARTLTVTGRLATRYATAGSRVYDLGCSLGACAIATAQAVGQGDIEIIGVDTSAAMLEKAAQIIEKSDLSTEIQLICEDVRDTHIAGASMVILNYTLQFIEPADRDALLAKIHAGLNPGGVLLLSEKVRFPASQTADAIIDLHEDFKRDHGYSELEIARKREAIENVLIPDSPADLSARLSRAGFADHGQWLQRYNFCSYVAFKA